MIKYEELPNTLVLIRSNDFPELYNKIGLVDAEGLEGEAVKIKLNSGMEISLPVHELFVLRQSADIEKDALNDQTLLPFWDFNHIMEVATFSKSAQKDVRMVAIELSRKDPNVFEYTMSSLAEELGLNRTQHISR